MNFDDPTKPHHPEPIDLLAYLELMAIVGWFQSEGDRHHLERCFALPAAKK